ncbi:MAG: LacI family DNA-binding transcriptional regulator [Propionibacteriaceae bacterium]
MPSRRVTIVDVARRAGVAKSTVSYALNGQPGVSDQVRKRVQEVARELGWRPSSIAQALSRNRVGACGLILVRDPHLISIEPFFTRLTTGLESELSRNKMALMIQFVPDVEAEIEAYRSWWGERRVDGVIMVDCRVDDPRLRLADHVDVPAVMLASPSMRTSVPCLGFGDGESMHVVVSHLHTLGHRRIGWVSGPTDYAHTVERRDAFLAACRLRQMEPLIHHGDYSTRSGANGCRELLRRDPRPTALVFDNDVMSLAGMGVLGAAGISVPEQMSVISWEDSALCTASHPELTSLHRDLFGYGVAGARALLDLIGGLAVEPRIAGSQRLVIRGSTARVSQPAR